LVAHSENDSLHNTIFKAVQLLAKQGPGGVLDLAVSLWPGSGEHEGGPFVVERMRACLRKIFTTLLHFNPLRSTKRWVSLKYVEHEKDEY
jgi:hypothetical protein